MADENDQKRTVNQLGYMENQANNNTVDIPAGV